VGVGGFSSGSLIATGASVAVAQGAIAIKDNFDEASKRARMTAKDISASFKGLQTSLQRIGRMTLPFQAMTAGGLAAAASVEQLNATVELLGGSLENLDKVADNLGITALQAREAAVGILPAIKGTNAGLEDTIRVISKLAVLDPFQGVEGGALAVREFLSGTYMSLVRRFELDRTKLKRVLDQANGDVGAMIEGLNELLSAAGVTDEGLLKLGENASTMFKNLLSDVKLLIAEAFMPLLKTLKPILEGLRRFINDLRETNPELLELIAGVTALVAAIGALSFALAPIAGLIATLFSGPIGIAAIIGAVATIAEVSNRVNEQGLTVAEALQTVLVDIATGIGNFIAALLEGINDLFEGLRRNFPELFGGEQQEGAQFFDALSTTLNSIDNAMGGGFGLGEIRLGGTLATSALQKAYPWMISPAHY